MSKTILITGTSSRLGLVPANTLHLQGFHVIGTSRDRASVAAQER